MLNDPKAKESLWDSAGLNKVSEDSYELSYDHLDKPFVINKDQVLQLRRLAKRKFLDGVLALVFGAFFVGVLWFTHDLLQNNIVTHPNEIIAFFMRAAFMLPVLILLGLVLMALSWGYQREQKIERIIGHEIFPRDTRVGQKTENYKDLKTTKQKIIFLGECVLNWAWLPIALTYLRHQYLDGTLWSDVSLSMIAGTILIFSMCSLIHYISKQIKGSQSQ